MKSGIVYLTLVCSILFLGAFKSPDKPVTIVVPSGAHARILFGAGKLKSALEHVGYKVTLVRQNNVPLSGNVVAISLLKDVLYNSASTAYKLKHTTPPGKEGFLIRNSK